MRDDGVAAEIEAPRRRIIKRPRLTGLLDEAEARILLLVAPAGYGKTTLAREWMEQRDRSYFWLTAIPALADVATLATRLRELFAERIPGFGAGIQQRLQSAGPKAADAEKLGRQLAESFERWGGSTWLVIDDYHFLTDSEDVETFIDSFVRNCPVQLLVSSRRRPTWATAKRLIYGEIHELGRSALAMTPTEASQILRSGKRGEASALVALADGWPAIIGLAAASPESDVPGGDIQHSLYDFFAEELYNAVDPAVRSGLILLAHVPTITRPLVRQLLGRLATHVLDEGCRVGFLQPEGDGYQMHSLIREFLKRRVVDENGDIPSGVSQLVEILFAQRMFDDLYEVVRDRPDFGPLIRSTLEFLLESNRIETIEPWVRLAVVIGPEWPEVDLASAELAFRDGNYAQAERLAIHSADKFGADSPLTSRAWLRAGHSANHSNRARDAVPCHQRARETAVRHSDRLEAVWGLLTATFELEEDPSELIRELRTLEKGPTSRLRIVNAQLSHAYRVTGNLTAALEDAKAAISLVDRVREPMVTSGFLNFYVLILVLTAYYERALSNVERELKIIRESGLHFAVPQALTMRGAAATGLRHFGEARASLAKAERAARSSDDDFSIGNVTLHRIRLHLCEGEPDRAHRMAVKAERSQIPTVQGELLTARALAAAAMGNVNEAAELVDNAEALTRSNETREYGAWARALISLKREDKDAEARLSSTFATSNDSGFFHAFVCAYRVYPGVLRILSSNDAFRLSAQNVLMRSRDETLARWAGIELPTQILGALSSRESEVLRLVTEGLSNVEIGRRLFISEATVKVHLRSVFAKLGVRTRTEAAVLATSGLADGGQIRNG